MGLLFAFSIYFNYVEVYDTKTHVMLDEITGYMIGFGHSPSPYVNGNTIALILGIGGSLSGVLTLAFTIWMLFSKSANPLKFLILSFSLLSSVLGLFFAIFAVLLFTSSNPNYAVNAKSVSLSFVGVISLVSIAINLLINFLSLIYMSINIQNKHVIIEGPKQ